MNKLRELYKQWYKEMNTFDTFNSKELKTDKEILNWNKEDLFYSCGTLQNEDILRHNKVCVETGNKDLIIKELAIFQALKNKVEKTFKTYKNEWENGRQHCYIWNETKEEQEVMWKYLQQNKNEFITMEKIDDEDIYKIYLERKN